jgi:hypothetical protein
MKLLGSIEKRHGMDEPGYTPPVDRPVIPSSESRPGWSDALWSLLVPIFGVVIGLKHLFRERVGAGLACLLLAGGGYAAWSVLWPVILPLVVR